MSIALAHAGCVPTSQSVDAAEGPDAALEDAPDVARDAALPGDTVTTDAMVLPDTPRYVDASVRPPFIVGLSQASTGVLTVLDGTGAPWIRQTFGWDDLEHEVTPNGMTLEQAMLESTLEAFSQSTDFTRTDQVIERFASRGVHCVLSVGSGWNRAVPVLLDGRPVAPDTLGPDEYIARQALVVRALVERYDGDGELDAPGSPRIEIFQIENELNEALTTALGGGRYPSGEAALGSAWASQSFLDRLFFALVQAARLANGDATLLTNLHVSVHPNFNRLLGVPSWQRALARWREAIDWIGLDAYPNFLRSAPVEGQRVGEQIVEAQSIGRGRPVIVIETGYPSGPSATGYDEARQVEFMVESFAAARAHGALGLFWYGSETSEEPFEASPEDVANLANLADAYERGDTSIVGPAFADRAYYETRIAPLVNAGSRHMGLVRADGSHKPAWDAFVAEVAR